MINSALSHREFAKQMVDWIIESETFYNSNVSFKFRIMQKLQKVYRNTNHPREEMTKQLIVKE